MTYFELWRRETGKRNAKRTIKNIEACAQWVSDRTADYCHSFEYRTAKDFKDWLTEEVCHER